MKDKINVANLLKGCPSGMELDCYLFDGLEFDYIDTDNENYPIACRAKTLDGEYYTHTFTKYGCYTSHYDYAKCVIFPKGKSTWEGFQRPFKVGDRIKEKTKDICGEIINVYKTKYDVRIGDKGLYLDFTEQDNWELVPDKFDINTLVPFESRVLIRDTKLQKWYPAIWGFYDSDGQDYQYKLVGVIARYCIPYECNEHLLGETDDCNEYFKTWK